jgi:hypothetical protein
MNALALADALRPYCYGVATRGHNVTATTDGGKVRIDCRTVTPAHFTILTHHPMGEPHKVRVRKVTP